MRGALDVCLVYLNGPIRWPHQQGPRPGGNAREFNTENPFQSPEILAGARRVR